MTTNTKTWTQWLTTPGDGVCPVPDCAEAAVVKFANGTQDSAHGYSWRSSSPAGWYEITHYRYAVPEDLAWLAREVSEWSPAPYHMDHHEFSFIFMDAGRRAKFCHPKSLIAKDGKHSLYSYDQWHRARQDLGLESAIKDHDARDRYTDVSELNHILKKARVEKARKKLAPIAGGVKMTQQHTSDGSTASYYELPEGATELQHLISHRNMNAQIGEVFRACYRYGQASHSDRLRDAKKIRFYADAEIARLEKLK